MKIVVSGCVRHRGRCVRRTDYVRKTYSIQGSCGDKKRKRLDFEAVKNLVSLESESF